MIKKSLVYIFLVLLSIHNIGFAQKNNEFSLLKTPEQIEKEKEEQYLKFQDFFFKALKERAQENYDKAILALDDCNTIYPNHVAVNFEYAKNYYNLKQYDNALDFIEKVLPEKPKETYVLEMAVNINRNLHDYDKAISLEKKLIQINPSYKNTLVYLYILNKQKEQARKVFAELQKEQLLDNRKDYFKGILFPKNSIKKKNTTISNVNSIAFEKKQFQKNKSYNDLKVLLEKEKKLQKYNELVVDSSEGLSLFPAQPYVYYINGFALNKQKRFQEALESLENGLDFVLDENKELLNQFYTEMATAYQGLGDDKNAKKYQSKVLK